MSCRTQPHQRQEPSGPSTFHPLRLKAALLLLRNNGSRQDMRHFFSRQSITVSRQPACAQNLPLRDPDPGEWHQWTLDHRHRQHTIRANWPFFRQKLGIREHRKRTLILSSLAASDGLIARAGYFFHIV